MPTGNVIYGATPWHQDSGVVNASADDTDMLTVWFPLMDTDVENGCLQVIPGSHRGEVLTHCGGVQGLNIPSTILPGEDLCAALCRCRLAVASSCIARRSTRHCPT